MFCLHHGWLIKLEDACLCGILANLFLLSYHQVCSVCAYCTASSPIIINNYSFRWFCLCLFCFLFLWSFFFKQNSRPECLRKLPPLLSIKPGSNNSLTFLLESHWRADFDGICYEYSWFTEKEPLLETHHYHTYKEISVMRHSKAHLDSVCIELHWDAIYHRSPQRSD